MPEPISLDDLFRTHGPAVYRRALRILGHRADAEEATQEVFIRAMRGLDEFRRQSEVTTWLYRITTNYCLNLIRDRRRQRELLDEHVAREGTEEAAPPAELVLVRRLLQEATPEQAQAAVYVHLDGMSHDEAAALLGVSRRTVGNLLARFEAEARRLLAEQAGKPESGRAGQRR